MLILGWKVMTNLDSILKSRDITLSTKARLVKAMAFPVVMYGCESWTVRKAERRRIDAFELWCWKRLLRDPWTARRSTQSILKEISPGCPLEGLMLVCHFFFHFKKIIIKLYVSVQFISAAQSCLTLCDPMNRRTPGLPVHHQLPESTQTHVHRVSDANQPSHLLSSPSPLASNPSQHQGLFQ